MNKTDYCLSLHTAYASKKKKVPLTKAACVFILNKPRVADENSGRLRRFAGQSQPGHPDRTQWLCCTSCIDLIMEC